LRLGAVAEIESWMGETYDTRVGIIGGGPSGLLLALLLRRSGIDSIVVERRSRAHVLSRVRAGVLEQGLASQLRRAGVGSRMDREGQVHAGIRLAFDDRELRLALEALTGGRSVMVYGQTELTHDLYAALDDAGQGIFHDAEDVEPVGFDTDRPELRWRVGDVRHAATCDFIAACDGYHGVGRRSVSRDRWVEHERVYPFGWLGVLARVRPVRDELVYASHRRGFALCSLRSASVSRYYLQVPADTRPGDWSDDRFWSELSERLPSGVRDDLETGPSFEKSVAPLRSFVAEPLRFGRLFLAGDAGHIVPPTGAKGLNLAASDVHYLSRALIARYRTDDESGVLGYSAQALSRVWRAVRFSCAFTRMTHVFPDEGEFGRRLRQAEFDHLAGSRAAQADWAENYVGLPY